MSFSPLFPSPALSQKVCVQNSIFLYKPFLIVIQNNAKLITVILKHLPSLGGRNG